MKEELLFQERQRFNRWLIVALLLLSNGLFLYAFISQYFVEKTWGNNPIDDWLFIIVSIFLLFISVWFFFIRLDTVINKDGVYFRMFPFHPRFQFKSWEQIAEAEVCSINPIKKLGGWGMRTRRQLHPRLNFGGGGIRIGIKIKSYTISGFHVLFLTLTNCNKIYIGTRKPEELSEFLIKLNAERKQK